MDTIFSFTPKDKTMLTPVYSLAKTKKVKLYLVGGILRDKLLKRERENIDFDFCLKKGAINFGRHLAKRIRAGFVVLDKDHGACRVVKKMEDKAYTLDFTDFRGKTLQDDLLHRDFTINALALELEKALEFTQSGLNNLLIDPYQGRRDLKRKCIRAINKKAFHEDALRILRAFSFAAMLGFKIDKATLRLIMLERKKLSGVSYERIRDELFKIFDTPNSFNYLTMTDKLKVLEIVFPEIKKMRNVKQGPYHHLNVWRHTLETVRQLEVLIQEIKINKEIQDYLNEFISGDRRRRALLKLGALLHDIGKPQALRHEDGKIKFHGHERIGLEISEIIARRLKLSCDEINALKRIVLWHLRPGYLADNGEPTARAIFRYFRDADRETISILLLSIADQRATKGRLTTQGSRKRHERVVFGLIKEYFRRLKERKMPRLINGDDLIRRFKLKPSPVIGKILSEIEELQAIGKIKNKSHALEAARRILAENNP